MYSPLRTFPSTMFCVMCQHLSLPHSADPHKLVLREAALFHRDGEGDLLFVHGVVVCDVAWGGEAFEEGDG